MNLWRILFLSLVAAAVVKTSGTSIGAEQGTELKTLKVGDTAKEAEFQPLDGKKVTLSELTAKGPVVLVVLRGFPGYQCPICTRQVAELRNHAKDFKQLGAGVVLVYPGSGDELKQRAKEFLKDKQLPEPLMLAIDPDFKFTELYGLRWNKLGETAYPSTFVLDKDRKVMFSKVSQSHGHRAKTEEVLDVLRAMRAGGAKGREIPQGVPIKVRR